MGEIVGKVIGWGLVAAFFYFLYSGLSTNLGEQLVGALWVIVVMFATFYWAIAKKIDDSRKDIFTRLSSLEKRLDTPRR